MILHGPNRCFFSTLFCLEAMDLGKELFLLACFFNLDMTRLQGSHEFAKFGHLCAFFWVEVHSLHVILKKLCELLKKD